MLRLLVVFVHVCAAMGVFGAAAIEGASLLELHRPGGSPIAGQGFELARRVGSISFALTLLSGIFLTLTVWGWEAAWIRLSMAGLIVMAVVGATMTRRAMAQLSDTSAPLHAHDLLIGSFLVRAGILIGIVFLMTVKPPLNYSLVAMGVAAGAGLLAGIPSGRQRATRAASQG